MNEYPDPEYYNIYISMDGKRLEAISKSFCTSYGIDMGENTKINRDYYRIIGFEIIE